jgi:hypothetical protein
MKSIISKLSLLLITAIISLLLFSSCSTTKTGKNRDLNYNEQIAYQALKYYKSGQPAKAKEVLREAMSKDIVRRSPYVKNNTLYMYAQNLPQTLLTMLTAAAFSIKKSDDTTKPSEEDIYLKELYNKTPWTTSVAIHPDYPMLYLVMGQILIDEKKYYDGIAYLDTATFMWK